MKIDIDANTQLATNYGIRTIPTIILLSKSKELARKSGALSSKKILDWLEEELD